MGAKAQETPLDNKKTITKEYRHRNGQRWNKLNYVNGQQHGLQERWYPSGMNPSDPWQTTDSARRRGGRQKYKLNCVNGQKHGVQERWYPSGVDPEDPW